MSERTKMDKAVLIRALMEFSGRSLEQVTEFLTHKSASELLALRDSPRVKPIFERLLSEKTAKAPAISNIAPPVMDLFCFASNNLTNIWAGVRAGLWAVAETSPRDMKARVTKSKRMKVGAAGLLYCKETHSFTSPFLVYSQPDPDRIVCDVWPEHWRLPFRIHPLGTPARQLHMDAAKIRWPMLKNVGAGGVSAEMNITGTTVFVPIQISADAWALIITDLAAM